MKELLTYISTFGGCLFLSFIFVPIVFGFMIKHLDCMWLCGKSTTDVKIVIAFILNSIIYLIT